MCAASENPQAEAEPYSSPSKLHPYHHLLPCSRRVAMKGIREEDTAALCSCYRWKSRFDVVVLVLVVVMVCGGGECYNVDTVTAVVHGGEPGSMFGFSVSQHIDQSTNW
ncbi:hypothetical protein ACOMHN_041730 [Nucella lapillus]